MANHGLDETSNLNYGFNGVEGEGSSMKHIEKVHNESLINTLEHRLVVGQKIGSVEEAFSLYREYAHAKGFSVRCGRSEYFSKTNVLNMKEFTCSCQGFKDGKCSIDRRPLFKKNETRTDCKARLRIGRKKGEEWKVRIFVMEHTHEMALPEDRHMLRSARHVSAEKGKVLKNLVTSGMTVVDAINCMAEDANGAQNLGFRRKDAYSFLNLLKSAHTKVENGDASELIRHFKSKVNEEGLFYWDVQLDENGRMANFFFRDGRCRTDYECFGEVVSFDTTYKTNKYDLICAPFVGLNHHKKNVIFGLAFLSDETTETFEWLFKTFLESMSNKEPETIFTDQCQSMMNAIEIVFSHACHRLCHCHINQNSPSKLKGFKGYFEIKELFNKCMHGCESKEEFEAVWNQMIVEHNLQEHVWLQRMYKLKHKWATAFSNHRFCAGLKATSISEGTNSVLKLRGNRLMNLCDFVKKYEKMLNRWRQAEKEDDYVCRHEKPPIILRHSLLLNHVASIYTHKIYHLFEIEFVGTLTTDLVELPSHVGAILVFKMTSEGPCKTIRTVEVDRQTMEMKCSCHHFESHGILCRHILSVFKHLQVNEIPEIYIKKRWSKNVKEIAYFGGKVSNESGHESEMVFTNRAMRWAYDLVLQSKSHAETQSILMECFQNAAVRIDDLRGSLRLNEFGMNRTNDEDYDSEKANDEVVEEQVLNPLYVKPKGISNARILSHWDKKKKRVPQHAKTAGRTDNNIKRTRSSSWMNENAYSAKKYANGAISERVGDCQPSHVSLVSLSQDASHFQPSHRMPLASITSNLIHENISYGVNNIPMNESFTNMLQLGGVDFSQDSLMSEWRPQSPHTMSRGSHM